MTPVFCCGFECGQQSATGALVGEHLKIYSNDSAVLSYDTTIKRSGGRSLKLSGNASARVDTDALFSSTMLVFRCYIYFAVLPNASGVVVCDRLLNTGVYFDVGDSKLYAYSSTGPTKSSTGVSVSTGNWYRLDVRLNVSENPWVLDVSVDGSALQTTVSTSANTASGIRFSAMFCTSGTFYFDDLVISNTSSDYPIGDGFINHFVPTSDGTHNVAGSNDFERGTTGTDINNSTTDSYLLVDDVPVDDLTPNADDCIGCIAPPNATDYTENVFGPASGISTPTTGPRAVEVLYAHHEAGTGLGVSDFKLNDNGTTDDVYAPGSFSGATTTRYARKHYPTMVGGGAWTAARFNALKCRFGYSSDANPDQFFDCAMIEAEFAPLTSIKTGQGLLKASVKSWNGLLAASTKTAQGLA